jgi:LuxR family glucitol operon transcriptional activator
LIQTAEQRGDWSILAEIVVDRGETLTAMGKPAQLEEADSLLMKAWELRQYQDRFFEMNLSKHLAILRIQQKRFDEAQSWLNQTLEFLENTELPEEKRLRWLTQIRYYQAEICFKQEAYKQAKRYFTEALTMLRQLIGGEPSFRFKIGWLTLQLCKENWTTRRKF